MSLPDEGTGASGLLESEKRVLSQIASGISLSKVLEELVLAVEAESDGEMCASVLLLDPEGKHLLHGAAPSLPVAYNEAIHGVEIGEAIGSCGTAAHRQEPVFVADIEKDRLWADFRDLPLAHGLRACWSTPIKAADGRLLGTFGNYYREPRSPTRQDRKMIALVTHTAALAIERHQADQALRESELRFRTLIEVSPQAVWFCGADGQMTYCNPFWHEFTGLTLGETRNGGWVSVVHPDHRERVQAAWKNGIDSHTTYEIEVPFKGAHDGQYRWFVVRGMPLRDVNMQVVRWIGIALDIHERKQAEGARELLTSELSHRIKNLFSVVSSLVSLTARGHPEAQAFAMEFRQRISSLASAHDYIRPPNSRNNPAAAGQTVHGLISKLLGPYGGDGRDRFAISGDDAPIGRNTATALALIIHEQATNAVKYGALSRDKGRVRINGRKSKSVYSMTWRESGGPRVSGPPSRHGFGTVLAAQSTAEQLGGGIEHDWAPRGLVMRLTVPLVNLAL